MERELAQVLRDQRDHARVVGPRGDLAEPDRVALHEELHAEEAAPAHVVGHGLRDALGLRERRLAHGLGLPGLVVVAADLPVPDRRAEARRRLTGPVEVPHREQRDLVVEVDEALDDHPPARAAGALDGGLPGRVDLRRLADRALPLAGRAHDGLHDAGQADGLDGGAELGLGLGEAIGRGGQAERLGGEAADALPVHGQARGAGRGDDGVALALEREEGVGGDGLDLRDDEVGLLFFDHRAELLGVEHREDVARVGDLHGRGVVVAVAGDDVDAEALELEGDLLAELAGAEQEDLRLRGGVRGAEADRHGRASNHGGRSRATLAALAGCARFARCGCARFARCGGQGTRAW